MGKKKNLKHDPMLSLNSTALDAVSILSAIRADLEVMKLMATELFEQPRITTVINVSEEQFDCDTAPDGDDADTYKCNDVDPDAEWLQNRDICAVLASPIALICVGVPDAIRAIQSNPALMDAKLFFMNDERYPANDGTLLWQVYATPEAEQYGPQYATFANLLVDIVRQPRLHSVTRLI
jgi:hypothetical protein